MGFASHRRMHGLEITAVRESSKVLHFKVELTRLLILHTYPLPFATRE